MGINHLSIVSLNVHKQTWTSHYRYSLCVCRSAAASSRGSWRWGSCETWGGMTSVAATSRPPAGPHGSPGGPRRPSGWCPPFAVHKNKIFNNTSQYHGVHHLLYTKRSLIRPVRTMVSTICYTQNNINGFNMKDRSHRTMMNALTTELHLAPCDNRCLHFCVIYIFHSAFSNPMHRFY